MAIACPNMWLSGRRFRKRSGENGRAYLRYLRISRSTGTILARMLLCVSWTPLGSGGCPRGEDDLREIPRAPPSPLREHRCRRGHSLDTRSTRRDLQQDLVQRPDLDPVTDRRPLDLIADQDDPRVDNLGDATEQVTRSPVVDGNDDRLREKTAPQRDHPLRPILAQMTTF